MYWNNPIIETRWPADIDPIIDSQHGGRHCLFFDPHRELNNIKTRQKLEDLCRWADSWLKTKGLDNFVADQKNHYDIANLVKLNMWIDDIKKQGIVKPWLMLDLHDGNFEAGTGDSRLRCLERIPEITSVAAFISTTAERRHLYAHLEEVTTFDQFAKFCKVDPNTLFIFRLTDPQAPYGLYWYEYSSKLTRDITPGELESVTMFTNYYKKNNSIKITPEWFDILVPWADYKSNN